MLRLMCQHKIHFQEISRKMYQDLSQKEIQSRQKRDLVKEICLVLILSLVSSFKMT